MSRCAICRGDSGDTAYAMVRRRPDRGAPAKKYCGRLCSMTIAGIDGRDDARKIAASFDLTKLPPEFYADPYPYYRALRDHEPVKRMPDGSWFLTRYDDIVPVYRDFKRL